MLSGPRINTTNTHGTGCTTASAIAAEFAKGATMLSAARAAKTYVSEALHSSTALQIGSGSQRPFNHGCVLLTSLWSPSAVLSIKMQMGQHKLQGQRPSSQSYNPQQDRFFTS